MMITALYAGILGLLYIALSIFVILGRWKYSVNAGDGGNENMLKRIRAHANFIEYVPFALILMFLIEYDDAPENLIHGLGIALVIGRVAHPIGFIIKFGPSIGRSGGMILTFGVIITAAITCIGYYFGF